MRDLGTLGGPFSLALSLNERGDVVGFSLTGEHLANGIAPWHAFLWHDGTLTDLGTLGGTFSEAWDVDDAGEVVGWSSLLGPKASTLSHAVLWRSGRVLDLNDLLEDPQGCVLNEARAIDGRGRILANAGCSGGSRVVLLTPSR